MWLSNLPFKNIGASNLSRFSQDGVFGFGRSPPISGGPSLPGRLETLQRPATCARCGDGKVGR